MELAVALQSSTSLVRGSISEGFPAGTSGKESARDAGLIPGPTRSPGEGNGSPPPCSCLENPMDRGTWWATVQRVTEESDMTEQLNSNESI